MRYIVREGDGTELPSPQLRPFVVEDPQDAVEYIWHQWCDGVRARDWSEECLETLKKLPSSSSGTGYASQLIAYSHLDQGNVEEALIRFVSLALTQCGKWEFPHCAGEAAFILGGFLGEPVAARKWFEIFDSWCERGAVGLSLGWRIQCVLTEDLRYYPLVKSLPANHPNEQAEMDWLDRALDGSWASGLSYGIGEDMIETILHPESRF